ncbi:MAG: hypothetical protein LBK99_21090 [Opitutaceae bacterium]|nr:hypothetical protein [Opitutaceae bacterium]
MSTTQTYLVAATIAAAGAGGYYITGQLTEADAPAPVVAQATPAPAAPDPEPFDAVDAMLNPFREIDAITRPAPPALPPPPPPSRTSAPRSTRERPMRASPSPSSPPFWSASTCTKRRRLPR